jgi:3-oxoacyl-[acyl-carrier protein] reductase
MIILTGASGGIGHAILASLSKLDDVIALYNTKAPNIEGLANVTLHKLDLTSEQDIANFALTIKRDVKKIVLINAAALSKDGLAAKYSTDNWDQVINVNLRGSFLLTKAMLIPMMEANWGRIIHISSVAAIRGVPGTIAYSAAKTGLLGMSRVLANEYARFGITSNVLVPGYFNTGLIETISEKLRKKILDSIPSGKLGDPSNIFNAIEFLIKSEYVNGSVVHLDGGM